MPYARVNEIDLYYELHGSGPPLLLVEGLGVATWCWEPILPALAASFTVIAFDNRGAGRSEKPDMPYSISLMADDAAGLLGALEAWPAFILGHSMGGYIAQELALVYPERVRGLILAASALSGDRATPEFLAAVAAVAGLPPEAALRQLLGLTAAPGFWDANPRVFEWILQARLQALPPAHAYTRQVAAAGAYNSRFRAGRIRQRTLVAGGTQDRVLPVQATMELARAIPGATLRLYESAGHYLFWEETDRFMTDLLEFTAME